MLQRTKLVAGLAVTAALLVPGVAQGKTTLVEVEATSHAVLHHLESLGLDVTYEGEHRTEVMLHGPEDKEILEDSGYAFKVLEEDLDGANDHYLEREGAAQARADLGVAPLSTLPTGRVAYRTLTDINAELQQLAATYPDKVKLFTLSETSLLGKPIYGVEVSRNIASAATAAKPSFLLTGVHHAREWPTAEFTLEFVWDLLLNDKTGDDAAALLDKGKLIAVPVVNPDGYDLSRSLQNEQKRKNCRVASNVIPTLAQCTASTNAGVDNNRNYLPFWGGPGSSANLTASNHRGSTPASEPENRGMIDLLNKSNVTVAINNHTPDQRLLRAPSSSNEPDVVADEVVYEALLQRLATNLPGWPAGPWTDVYYEASSTAEQQAYYAYGAFGFTPEATPGFAAPQTFHPPYQNVIDNYLGTGTRYANQTMRGLYYEAFEAATEADLHSVLKGTAPAGAKLTLSKSTMLDSSSVVWTTGQPAAIRAFPNAIAQTITVPASGTFDWHINPSGRPSQYNATHLDESYDLVCAAADGTVLERTTLKIARGQVANRSLCTPGSVGGTVPATLGLTLGSAAAFGAFTPGVAKEYDASALANVISTAGNAALAVSDPDPVATGKLVNGAFALAQPLRAAASSPAGGAGAALAAVGGSANPTSLLTWSGPVSNDPVTVAFKQAIGAGDPLRTGTYSKTLTFTLSTTNP